MLPSLVEKLPANALLQTPRKVHTRPTEKPDRRSGIFRKPTFQVLPGPVHVEDFDRITVIDVFRELGIEPTPELTWAVGAAGRVIPMIAWLMRKRCARRFRELGIEPTPELRGELFP